MKTLADRIRQLHPGYQGMDDQASIAKEVHALEVSLKFWILEAEKLKKEVERLKEIEWKYQ